MQALKQQVRDILRDTPSIRDDFRSALAIFVLQSPLLEDEIEDALLRIQGYRAQGGDKITLAQVLLTILLNMVSCWLYDQLKAKQDSASPPDESRISALYDAAVADLTSEDRGDVPIECVRLSQKALHRRIDLWTTLFEAANEDESAD